ncbi:hypothetical protein LentiSH36_02739 [Lentibacter algarum]|jgi:hypothetical protein|uniref:Uncharacterized protein n=1 Tax=Lentibacter algarum TaxID=576131 RepID=A0A1H3MIL5_9RHOB|nr:hypothetical protein LentiSH36_02739 [Lentibacter algarum]SDY76520.1 hypothetical protein SAMN05444486_103638 [Lentibacter algarum]
MVRERFEIKMCSERELQGNTGLPFPQIFLFYKREAR